MKRILYPLLISLALVFIVHLTLFDNTYTTKDVSNAFFVVGLVMFLVGLMVITDASKIFMVVVYSFKQMRRQHRKDYPTYYDYAKEREKEGMVPYALEIFLIGIVYLIVAFIFSQLYFQTL
ncbi:MAG: DUF3899 domain-containing protein [Acholeplasmataceae bacterium]